MGLAGDPGLQLGSKEPHWSQWVWERELGGQAPGGGCADLSLSQSLTNPHDPKCGPGKSSHCEPRVCQRCRLSGRPSQAARASNTPEMLLNTVRSEGTQPSSQAPLPHHHPAPHQCPSTHFPPKFTLLLPDIKLLPHSPGDSLFPWRVSAGLGHRHHGDICLFKMRELDHKES